MVSVFTLSCVVVLEIVVVLETAKGVRLQVAKSIDPEHESHQNLCMPCPTHNVHVYRQDFVRYLDLLQISSSVFNVQGLACQVSLFKSPLHCSNGAKVRYGTLERCKNPHISTPSFFFALYTCPYVPLPTLQPS